MYLENWNLKWRISRRIPVFPTHFNPNNSLSILPQNSLLFMCTPALMVWVSCCPQADCSGDKSQRIEFRCRFSRKILKMFTNINYINRITEIKFHKLQNFGVYDLDNCVLYQCWKFYNIPLKPCKDIVREILVIRDRSIWPFWEIRL